MSVAIHNPALEFSPFLKRLVSRQPEWLESLQSTGRLDKASPPDVDQLTEMVLRSGLNSALRRFRNREITFEAQGSEPGALSSSYGKLKKLKK